MFKNKWKPHIGVKSIILTGACGLLVAVDLLTKYFAKRYPEAWTVKIIPGWVELNGYIPNNQGCAFSFLNENPQIGQPILITLTILMLAFLIGAFIFIPERFTVLKVSVTLVAAGAVGNLADRFMYRSVRDFFGLNMLFDGSLVYCNFADFFVVVGAILAVVDLLFLDEFAVFPLTKRAKAAQAAAKEKQSNEGSGNAVNEENADGGERREEEDGGDGKT